MYVLFVLHPICWKKESQAGSAFYLALAFVAVVRHIDVVSS